MTQEQITAADDITVHPRILLVDDERNVVDSLGLQLRRRYRVTTTSSPVEAVELVRREQFAAVVSDLRMPLLDGVGLLTQVRTLSPSTVRILLTGQGDLESAAAAVNSAGVHAVLLKPSTASSIAETIQRALSSVRSVDGDAVIELGQRAALGSMAGAIGHEIGNLAAALGGSIALLHQQTEHGEAIASEDVALLSMINNRLTDHARHLRDLSKPRPFEPTHVDVAQVLVETIGLMQKSGILRTVPVVTEISSVPPIALADRPALEGMIMNLLKNATEAVEARMIDALGRGALPKPSSIVGRVTTEKNFVALEIQDAGIGISAARLPRIFEPHRSSKGHRGSGLGLGIVKAAAERMRGTIAIASEVGVGTTVTIRLPRARTF